MSKRLLIALPVAAVVVIGLFGAMKGLVPVGRPVADYTVRVSPNRVTIYRCPHSCVDPPPINRKIDRPNEDKQESYLRLPMPPRPEPEAGRSTKIPRERFPAPDVDGPEPGVGQDVPEHCRPHMVTDLHFPDGAHEDDQVTVEFRVTADGKVEDVRVIDSTNPKINDEVVGMVKRWHWAYPEFCMGHPPVKVKSHTIRTRIEFRNDGQAGATGK